MSVEFPDFELVKESNDEESAGEKLKGEEPVGEASAGDKKKLTKEEMVKLRATVKNSLEQKSAELYAKLNESIKNTEQLCNAYDKIMNQLRALGLSDELKNRNKKSFYKYL